MQRRTSHDSAQLFTSMSSRCGRGATPASCSTPYSFSRSSSLRFMKSTSEPPKWIVATHTTRWSCSSATLSRRSSTRRGCCSHSLTWTTSSKFTSSWRRARCTDRTSRRCCGDTTPASRLPPTWSSKGCAPTPPTRSMPSGTASRRPRPSSARSPTSRCSSLRSTSSR